MNTILAENSKQELIKRINSLKKDDKALWGKMNAGEMLCHITDQVRLAVGAKDADFIGNAIQTTVLKWLVLFGLPIPKGTIETVKELKQGIGGTKPSSLENDKSVLIDLLINFENSFVSVQTRVHPAFGTMSKWQWARIAYIHIDYHLKQFNR